MNWRIVPVQLSQSFSTKCSLLSIRIQQWPEAVHSLYKQSTVNTCVGGVILSLDKWRTGKFVRSRICGQKIYSYRVLDTSQDTLDTRHVKYQTSTKTSYIRCIRVILVDNMVELECIPDNTFVNYFRRFAVGFGTRLEFVKRYLLLCDVTS